jgi:hypothetical protein
MLTAERALRRATGSFAILPRIPSLLRSTSTQIFGVSAVMITLKMRPVPRDRVAEGTSFREHVVFRLE